MMASDESGDESAFTDCAASGPEMRTDTPAGRQRRLSVTEMIRRAESRKSKRPAPDRGSKSPHDQSLPAAKRPLAEPAERAGTPGSPGVELSAGALSAIQRLLSNGIASIASTLEVKCEKIDKRLDLLESEAMDRDAEMRRLNEKLACQSRINAELLERIEGIDLNRRLASLILTSDEFSHREQNEDIEKKIVRVLNERIPNLSLTTSDIHAAHRLQRDDKVIVKFVKRGLRDAIYDARFNMTSAAGGHRRAPLYSCAQK